MSNLDKKLLRYAASIADSIERQAVAVEAYMEASVANAKMCEKANKAAYERNVAEKLMIDEEIERRRKNKSVWEKISESEASDE